MVTYSLMLALARELLNRQAAARQPSGAAGAMPPAARRRAGPSALRQPPGEVELVDMSPEAGRRTGCDGRSPADQRCGCRRSQTRQVPTPML